MHFEGDNLTIDYQSLVTQFCLNGFRQWIPAAVGRHFGGRCDTRSHNRIMSHLQKVLYLDWFYCVQYKLLRYKMV